MAVINPTIQLAKTRSKIDQQQQVISQLELEMQAAILGSPANSSDGSLRGVVDKIIGIYEDTNSDDLEAAFVEGILEFNKADSLADLDNVLPEQDSIRHMLYQARALLGELRVEEQHWNTEAQEEKARRKELADHAKG